MGSEGRFDLGELVKLHGAMLQRRALHLCGNADTAKDLVQETLLRAHQRSDQLGPGTNPAAWLVTILTNLFLDQLKHAKVELKALPELTLLKGDARDTAITHASDAALYAAIDALESDLRAVVELCYLKEIRYREAAAILKVPLGTISSRLKRARERLLELLTTTRLTVVP